MKEIWKDIPEYDGFYQVSNNGRVRSWKNNKWGKSETPRILSQGINSRWDYKYVILSKDNNQSIYSVHRLVAKAFIPNPENKPQVNHIDGNKHNNCISNLEWCTQSENFRHDFVIGNRDMKGENHSNNTLTDNEVLSIRSKYRTGKFTQSELAGIHNISQGQVSQIVNKKSWVHV